jgi:hypothetical protein
VKGICEKEKPDVLVSCLSLPFGGYFTWAGCLCMHSLGKTSVIAWSFNEKSPRICDIEGPRGNTNIEASSFAPRCGRLKRVQRYRLLQRTQ